MKNMDWNYHGNMVAPVFYCIGNPYTVKASKLAKMRSSRRRSLFYL